MREIFKEYSSYFTILFICLINIRAIVKGVNNYMGKYGKLAEEEKQLYDISKVKVSLILHVLSLVLVTVLAFIFTEIYPNIIAPKTFILCYLAEVVVLLILSYTKWILNWFCKKN